MSHQNFTRTANQAANAPRYTEPVYQNIRETITLSIKVPNILGTPYNPNDPNYQTSQPDIYKVSSSNITEKGSDISNKLYKHLNIPLEDQSFFGIAIPPIPVEGHRHFKWLRDDKLLRKQVNSQSQMQNLQMALKIYPNHALKPVSEAARKKACYLIRNMITNNLLFPSTNLTVQLYALTLQALYGDHRNLDNYRSSYNREEILQILSETDKSHHNVIEKLHIDLAGKGQETAELEFLQISQQIELYGVHLFEVCKKRENDERERRMKVIDIGVNLDGILFFEDRIPKNVNELLARKENPGWARKSNFIQWRRIQKLKYRDKQFLIEYMKPVPVNPDSLQSGQQHGQNNTIKYEIVSEPYKLNNFRLCKDLYFTCIYHHEMFKRAQDGFTNRVNMPGNQSNSSQQTHTSSQHHNYNSGPIAGGNIDVAKTVSVTHNNRNGHLNEIRPSSSTHNFNNSNLINSNNFSHSAGSSPRTTRRTNGHDRNGHEIRDGQRSNDQPGINHNILSNKIQRHRLGADNSTDDLTGNKFVPGPDIRPAYTGSDHVLNDSNSNMGSGPNVNDLSSYDSGERLQVNIGKAPVVKFSAPNQAQSNSSHSHNPSGTSGSGPGHNYQRQNNCRYPVGKDNENYHFLKMIPNKKPFPKQKPYGQGNVFGFYLNARKKVSYIAPGSPADKAKLSIDDEIIQINNVQIDEMSIEQTNAHLKSAMYSEFTTFLVIPSKASASAFASAKSPPSNMKIDIRSAKIHGGHLDTPSDSQPNMNSNKPRHSGPQSQGPPPSYNSGHRHIDDQNQGRYTNNDRNPLPVYDQSSNQNTLQVQSQLANRPKNTIHPNKRDPINILKNSMYRLKQKSTLDFHTEFSQVAKVNPNMKISEAYLEKNRGKNRYTDIVPYDETRVILISRDNNGQPSGDYINANFCTINIDQSLTRSNNLFIDSGLNQLTSHR